MVICIVIDNACSSLACLIITIIFARFTNLRYMLNKNFFFTFANFSKSRHSLQIAPSNMAGALCAAIRM